MLLHRSCILPMKAMEVSSSRIRSSSELNEHSDFECAASVMSVGPGTFFWPIALE